MGAQLSLDALRGSIVIRWNRTYFPLILLLAFAALQYSRPVPGLQMRASLPHTVEPHSTALYLLAGAACVAVLFTIDQGCRSASQIRLLVLAFIGLGVFESIYGVVQYLGDYRSVWGFPAGDRVARGTFMNRNHYALLLNLSISMTFGYCWFRWFGLLRATGLPPREALHAPGSGNVLWLLLLLLFQGFALVLSLSRMGSAAMLASIAVMAANLFATDRRNRILVLGGLAVIAAILALGAYTAADAILTRFELIAEDTFVEQDRLVIWRDAWTMIRGHLLFGQGLGTFQWTFPAFETTRADLPARYAHNDYLQVLAEMGIIGLALSLLVLLLAWRTAAQSFRSSADPFVRAMGLALLGCLTATALQEITDFGLYIPGVALAFAFLLGINLRVSRNL
jgi:O-antigen ligase